MNDNEIASASQPWSRERTGLRREDRRVAGLVNLTPHDLDIYGDDGHLIITVPRSGTQARLGEMDTPSRVLRDEASGREMPVRTLMYTGQSGVPAPAAGHQHMRCGPLLGDRGPGAPGSRRIHHQPRNG